MQQAFSYFFTSFVRHWTLAASDCLKSMKATGLLKLSLFTNSLWIQVAIIQLIGVNCFQWTSFRGCTQVPRYSLWNSFEKYSEQQAYIYSDPLQESSSMQRQNLWWGRWGRREPSQEAMPPFLYPTQRLFLNNVEGSLPISIVSTEFQVYLIALNWVTGMRFLRLFLAIVEVNFCIIISKQLILRYKYPKLSNFSPNQVLIQRFDQHILSYFLSERPNILTLV